jgi:hypothetical protein
MNVVFVLDTSVSMRRQCPDTALTYLDAARLALIAFVRVREIHMHTYGSDE